MPYADFTLESAETTLGVLTGIVDLIPAIEPAPVPAWLEAVIDLGHGVVGRWNEKARSEFLVAPVLVAAANAISAEVALFSGYRLDVDTARGLFGECDFLIALTTPVPRLRAPVMTLVQAKNADIELGLGQCIAQMFGARLFNEKEGEPERSIYGCVTTGEDWQFLRLVGVEVHLDRRRFYLPEIGLILAVFRTLVARSLDLSLEASTS